MFLPRTEGALWATSLDTSWPCDLRPTLPLSARKLHIWPGREAEIRADTELTMLALVNRLLDWFRSLFWKEEMELTLVGLQYSGKTTFVNVIAVSQLLLATLLGGANDGAPGESWEAVLVIKILPALSQHPWKHLSFFMLPHLNTSFNLNADWLRWSQQQVFRSGFKACCSVNNGY